MQANAEAMQAPAPEGPASISAAAESFVAALVPAIDRKIPARGRFVVDDILYEFSATVEGSGTRLRIWADIGYIPYTIQSPERRRDIMTILRATQRLGFATFRIDDSQKIVVTGDRHIAGSLDLEGLVYESLLFLQEIRPYLRVLAGYL